MKKLVLTLLTTLSLFSFDIRSNQYDLISNQDLIPQIRELLKMRGFSDKKIDEVIKKQTNKEIKEAITRSIVKGR